MGLDMYLRAKRHFYDADDKVPTQIAKLVGVDQEVSEVIFKAIYWRKANAIHAWFVENVQEGEDDCSPYELEKEKLIELLDLCKKALETKDATLLPTSDGCFFGSTEIDDYYWWDIQQTITGIDKALKDFGDKFYFEYQSSW
jgi:hypothetical protein